MPDGIRKRLDEMFIDDAHIGPMPGQERREWFDRHPVIREIGQMLTGGALDPRLSDEPPGPVDFMMQAAPALKAIPMLASPGRFKMGAAGLEEGYRGASAMKLGLEDLGLTPADFSRDIPKDIKYTGWNREASDKFSQQMQTRGGGYSGRPLNMEAIDKIAKGEKVPTYMFQPNSRAGSKRMDLELSKQGFQTGRTGGAGPTRDPYTSRRGKVDDKQLTEIRRLGNNVWKDLTTRQAARQIKATIDTPLSEDAIVDILHGDSFPRPNMNTRTKK